jgi:hypothetical protein
VRLLLLLLLLVAVLVAAGDRKCRQHQPPHLLSCQDLRYFALIDRQIRDEATCMQRHLLQDTYVVGVFHRVVHVLRMGYRALQHGL